MRRLLLALLVSCSAPSTPRATAVAPPPPATPDAAVAPEATAETWVAHACRSTVWPYYDSDYGDDDEPQEAVSYSDDVELDIQTLDDKAAAAAAKAPHAGVCDP